jgi:hypothetical protein
VTNKLDLILDSVTVNCFPKEIEKLKRIHLFIFSQIDISFRRFLLKHGTAHWMASGLPLTMTVTGGK